MRREELESRRNGKAAGWNSFDADLFLYLPITPKPDLLLPVTTINYAFPASGRASLKKLKCGMFMTSKPAGTYEGLHAVGFRYESPEQSPRHRYWHAQSIYEFKRKAPPRYILPTVPLWIPVDTPAIPLPASEPAGLVAALLTSLYGPDEVLSRYGADVEKLLSRGEGAN